MSSSFRGAVKKEDLGIESRHVYMYLLIHPKSGWRVLPVSKIAWN